MHDLTPHHRWEAAYIADEDERSPFYRQDKDRMRFTHAVYNHYIHRDWDAFGSSTLYMKLLYADYVEGYAIMEFIGEWNGIRCTMTSCSSNGFSGPGAVNMGNPHVVFFVNEVRAVPIESLGPKVEHDPLFPQRVNVGFAEVRSPEQIRRRGWERGAGLTKACGTGACAAVVAAHRQGRTGRKV